MTCIHSRRETLTALKDSMKINAGLGNSIDGGGGGGGGTHHTLTIIVVYIGKFCGVPRLL